MKLDYYTKTVLTIIALCLLVMTGKNVALFPNATAADLNHPAYATIPVNADGSMNVHVVGMPESIDVNIISCESHALKYSGPISVVATQ